MSIKGWHGFDLDGTLAQFDKFRGVEHIGDPLGVDKPDSAYNELKRLLESNEKVKIFTARWDGTPEERRRVKRAIDKFCRENFGQVLEITNVKDKYMLSLRDDKAIQIAPSTGVPVVKRVVKAAARLIRRKMAAAGK